MSSDKPLSRQTLAVRFGQQRTAQGEHRDPIFLTSSYVFDSAEQAEARFAGDEEGNVYSRYTNPNLSLFERRLAALEGGAGAVSTASGMAAIATLCLSLLRQGDHVVCSRSVFGATIVLFEKYLTRYGISSTFVPLSDLDAWRQAITPQTRLLFLETPSNPLNEIADIGALAELARQHHCLLSVDNCFCTPALQRPLALGADLVVHSATKFLDGQGRCLGGAIVGAGDHVEALDEARAFLRCAGPTMSPFSAWVFLQGLETLELRMRQHCANALQLAKWLSGRPEVGEVFYAGLPDHPGHDLAKRQQDGFGGVLAFTIPAGKAAAFKVVNATRLCSLTANLGDARTTIVHPATTTHGKLDEASKRAVGISDDLIRIAAGLEHADDLCADLAQAFAVAGLSKA